MRSGVLTPLGVVVPEPVGTEEPFDCEACAGERRSPFPSFKASLPSTPPFCDFFLSPRNVVDLPTWVVSALGGGGSPANSSRSCDGGPWLIAMGRGGGRTLARQRKHSPVAK